MGKRRKQQSSSRQDFMGTDKPAYAADWFREVEKPRSPHPEQAAEAAAGSTVEEHLGKSAIDALTQLKAQMAQEEAVKAVKRSDNNARAAASGAGEKSRRFGQAAASRDMDAADAKSDASFAELFDPQEPDNGSFEELLGKSKLDWRAFKE